MDEEYVSNMRERLRRDIEARFLLSDLRDRFAIAAMQASLDGDGRAWDAECSRWCYEIADLMLQARAEAAEKGEEPQP